MSNTDLRFSYLISDERWGETCLVDNLDQFMADMEDSMFPASVVSQKLSELHGIAAERDGECEECEETIAQAWRDDLRDALQAVEIVEFADGRIGWKTSNGSVYVHRSSGLASYIGEWKDLNDG